MAPGADGGSNPHLACLPDRQTLGMFLEEVALEQDGKLSQVQILTGPPQTYRVRNSGVQVAQQSGVDKPSPPWMLKLAVV